MTDAPVDHQVCVDAWFDRTAKSLDGEPLVAAFEQAFRALWQRAERPLGSVTLTAIVDRVIYRVAEECSAFSALKVEETGLDCTELRERAGSLAPEELRQGVRLALVEFLTVLGNLTAQVLSPALQAALSKSGPTLGPEPTTTSEAEALGDSRAEGTKS